MYYFKVKYFPSNINTLWSPWMSHSLAICVFWRMPKSLMLSLIFWVKPRDGMWITRRLEFLMRSHDDENFCTEKVTEGYSTSWEQTVLVNTKVNSHTCNTSFSDSWKYDALSLESLRGKSVQPERQCVCVTESKIQKNIFMEQINWQLCSCT